MFNDKYGLHNAVMEGKKTQTRRLIPNSVLEKADKYRVEYYNETFDALTLKEAIEQLYFVEKILKLPYNIGDIVPIAQRYSDIVNEYAELKDIMLDRYGMVMKEYTSGWNNKMFVQGSLMPHHIKITNVRIENLQDISDSDALKEGVYFHETPPKNNEYDRYSPWYPSVKPYKFDIDNNKYFRDARYAYAYLIDKISGSGTWKSNPMVMVYDFELID